MATVKDIAKAVGVSTGTVDRIIHKRGRYSEETAAKVRKAMKDLNYTPNIHARGLKKTKKHHFAVVMPRKDQDGGYWSLVEAGILNAAGELLSYGSEVEIFSFDNYSAISCKEALSLAISSGAEGLLVAPTRPLDMKKQLIKTSIPFVFIDSDIPELDNRTSTVGQDSFQSGILSGKLMNLLLAGKAGNQARKSVLVVDPPASNYHLKSRIDGFRIFMKKNQPDTSLITFKEEVDDESKVHETLKAHWQNEAGRPTGIFVANSSVYYIATFLDSIGEKDIPLIGYDLIPGREDVIEEGIIDFILTQQPEEQGYKGLMMLYDTIVLKKDVEKEVITPLNIITRENLQTFIKDRAVRLGIQEEK